MALPKGMTLTQEKVSQKFNLEEIFGVDFSERPDLKAQIGQAIIDKIIERTSEGKKRGGGSFDGGYSTSYKKSEKFEQYGKSSTINMELTGAMLDSIDIIKEFDNQIEIGFSGPDAELQNAKAFGHETSMRGHKFLQGKAPKRPFFGLTADELKEIKAEFKQDIRDIDQEIAIEKEVNLASMFEVQRGASLPSGPTVRDFTLFEDFFNEG